jgi:hypothetical protein
MHEHHQYKRIQTIVPLILQPDGRKDSDRKLEQPQPDPDFLCSIVATSPSSLGYQTIAGEIAYNKFN